MRKYIDIINEAFGSETLSRATDPSEIISFKVFCTKEADVASINSIISRFAVEVETSPPSPSFRKYTFYCRGPRKEAEAIQRSVKMARIEGGITRID